MKMHDSMVMKMISNPQTRQHPRLGVRWQRHDLGCEVQRIRSLEGVALEAPVLLEKQRGPAQGIRIACLLLCGMICTYVHAYTRLFTMQVCRHCLGTRLNGRASKETQEPGYVFAHLCLVSLMLHFLHRSQTRTPSNQLASLHELSSGLHKRRKHIATMLLIAAR